MWDTVSDSTLSPTPLHSSRLYSATVLLVSAEVCVLTVSGNTTPCCAYRRAMRCMEGVFPASSRVDTWAAFAARECKGDRGVLQKVERCYGLHEHHDREDQTDGQPQP